MGAKIEPTWHRGMYGCPQDMYGASVVLPMISELEHVRRLHEVATERTVALAAVIEQARTHLRVIEGADTDILHGRPVMDAAEEKSLSLRLLGELFASADTDAALREVRAAAFDEAAGYFGENQMTREGDVKEWLTNKATAIREGRA